MSVLIVASCLSLIVGQQWSSLERVTLERELLGSAAEQVGFAHELKDALTRQLMELAFHVITKQTGDIENFREHSRSRPT